MGVFSGRRGGTGGGGTGFRLGMPQNTFGSTTSTLTQAEAARDAYAVDPNNSTWLPSYDADSTTGIYLLYLDSGNVTIQPQSRSNSAWVNNAGFIAVQGRDGADGTALEFTSTTNRDSFFELRPDLLRNGLPINVGVEDDVVTIQVWTGADSPATYNPSTDGALFIPASLRTSTGSLELGDIHTVSSGGDNVFFTNRATNIAYFPAWQSVGDHSEVSGRVVQNRPTARVYGDLQFIERRGTVATTGTSEYMVEFTPSVNQSVFGIRVIAAENYTGIAEYRITEVSDDRIVYQQRIEADVTTGNEFVLWFDYPVEGRSGTNIRAEIIKSDNTRAIVRPVEGGTEPYSEVRLRTFTDVDLAYDSDVVQSDWTETDTSSNAFILNKPSIPQGAEHPVTLRRDMPSEADATALAASSLNGNSALWIVANNQNTNSNRADATVRALQSGFLDLNDNPISTNAVTASTIQLRGGTIVRIFSANEYRIVNSPVFESDISSGTTSAEITRFEIQGVSTSVVAPFTLSGTQTFSYNINHPEDVNGNLTLRQNGVVLRSDISPTANSFTQTVTTQTLQNNQTSVFELRGTTNEGVLLSQFYRVRAHAPAERLFSGLSSSNNPADVNISSFSVTEAGVDNTRLTTGAASQGNYFIILVPADQDLTSIQDTVLQQEVLSIFTKTNNVRTIDTVMYDSYVIGELNAGFNESYILRF